MLEPSLTISILALLVSLATFYFTRIRKGTIKMTKPTVIFFGPDGPGANLNKVFIRTLLYSTSDKGQYIENMYIRLQRNEATQNFNIWVYGDKNLVRGSGLFVSKHGFAANHHFLMQKDCSNFEYKKGKYQLDIFAEIVNSKPKKIYTQLLEINSDQGKLLTNKKAGIYFDWAPDTQQYSSHIDQPPKKDKTMFEFIKHLED
jgi:hypothetical protein